MTKRDREHIIRLQKQIAKTRPVLRRAKADLRKAQAALSKVVKKIVTEGWISSSDVELAFKALIGVVGKARRALDVQERIEYSQDDIDDLRG